MATHRPKMLQQVQGINPNIGGNGMSSSAFQHGWVYNPDNGMYFPTTLGPDGTAKKGDWMFDALGPDPHSGIFFLYSVPS